MENKKTKLDYSLPLEDAEKNIEKTKEKSDMAKIGIDKQKIATQAMNIPQSAPQQQLSLSTSNKGFGRTM